MTPKEQLYYLIEKYHEGKYDTPTFADQFDIIYWHDMNEEDLSKEEIVLFRELAQLTSRYSLYEEDHIKYPGVYYKDDDVRKKAEEVYQKTRKFR